MNPSILALSFLEGVGLILSPCILPILPLVLATGIQGGKLRPFGIILGFISAFVAFTFFARFILTMFHLDPQVVQNISIYFIILFGIVLYSDYLSDKFSLLSQRLANVGQNLSTQAEQKLPSGFWSGILLGMGIALVWTPCAGPILAAVLVQTLQEKADFGAFLILLSFSVGVGTPMLFLILFSKSLVSRVRVLSKHTQILRKILAVIIIITMLFIKFNLWEEIFQLQSPPTTTTTTTTTTTQISKPVTHLINGLESPYNAPQIGGITKWINSPPLNLTELSAQGKVVLIDFWTYSCINCVRTLPYIKDWYEKYHDKGLVIIGVHSPEFEFEKNIDNVEKAVKADGIKYPVAMDNNLTTWQNFDNLYWPAHYLINKQGQVVYTHFGEGEYDVTENNIRFLLGLGKMEAKKESPAPLFQRQSPETYLGSDRMEGFANKETLILNETTDFKYPSMLEGDQWALKGKWKVLNDRIVSEESGASLEYHFRAKEVYLVLASQDPDKLISAEIYLNGKPIGSDAGKDVKEGKIMVMQNTLYELVRLKAFGEGIVEIKVDSPGLEAYAFTFGAE